MRRNPYVTALSALGAMALILALILTFVLFGVTTDEAHDVQAAGGLTGWTYVLVGIGITSLVGVVVIAGVAWTLRKAGFDV